MKAIFTILCAAVFLLSLSVELASCWLPTYQFPKPLSCRHVPLASPAYQFARGAALSDRTPGTVKTRKEQNDDVWDSNFERLLGFKEVHGHTLVRRTYNDGKRPYLGNWVDNQRAYFKKQKLSFSRQKRLQDIGFTWSLDSRERQMQYLKDDSWDASFKRLERYKEEFGHVNVPSRYSDGSAPHLGKWAKTLRTFYKVYLNTRGLKGHLTKERIARLESLGFQWTDTTREEKNDERWMLQFEKVKAFKHKYNTTKLSRGPSGLEFETASILKWSHMQRSRYSLFVQNRTTTLTQEKVDLLNSIDFAWDMQNKTDHEKWIYKYFKLYWHHSEFNNTDIALSNGHTSDLVSWVYRQKRDFRAGKLDQGKIDLLDELGFDWRMDPELAWEEMFEELSQYYSRYNSTLINSRIDDILGPWTTELRKLYAAGDLDPKWATKLNSLDFQWHATEDIDWNAMLDRLVAYKRRYGNTCVPTIYNEDRSLGKWVNSVRFRYGKFFHLKCSMTLTTEDLHSAAEKLSSKRLSAGTIFTRLKNLCDIGFVWSAYDADWVEMYTKLVQYKEENGNTLVPVGSGSLGHWLGRQRRDAESLCAERRELLDKLGFEWDPLEARWQEMFQELCKYKARHGDTLVQINNGELGCWVNNQKQRYREKRMSEKRIKDLESIGFAWYWN